MDTSSVPQPTIWRTTREERGIVLFRERSDEIKHVRGWSWLVPACSGDGLHAVDIETESCDCLDARRQELSCEHVYAARIASSKSGECAGCGRKVGYRDLHEVGDDNLTFFEGDVVCESCAMAHGIL
jgi:hypothetical protein